MAPTKFIGMFVIAVLGLVTAASAQVQVDPKLADYQQASGVSGKIVSVGSDTMNNLMTFWCEDFIQMYPNVQSEVEGKGSSTAPPALIKGKSNFGPMSRTMKSKEAGAFEKAYGYAPTPLKTSIDLLAVFVHKDNPIAAKGLALQQLDAIFSKTLKGGSKEDITRWGQVGLSGDWANKSISLYGRNSASGTYGYFKKKALFKGSYKDSVKEQPGSAAVVQGVASDLGGIGYSGIGYATADVATVPLSKDGKTFVPASADKVSSYPLARFLYVYINKKPNAKLEPLRKEFLKYVFSKQGQEKVAKAGYLPISAAIASKELETAGVK